MLNIAYIKYDNIAITDEPTIASSKTKVVTLINVLFISTPLINYNQKLNKCKIKLVINIQNYNRIYWVNNNE